MSPRADAPPSVTFCDLVGSSALGQRLGAGAYRRVVQADHARATKAVERYDGYVGQYQGEGLLVYFGYPQAHEDVATRRAGSSPPPTSGSPKASTPPT